MPNYNTQGITSSAGVILVTQVAQKVTAILVLLAHQGL